MADKTRPLVTIGIPTYNRASGFLTQALESAVNQTYPNIEIIVSDNCSTDHTEEVVHGFSSPRIRYFKHTENIGPINNFNFCVQEARGQYFLMLHDDDLIDPDFVEACMTAVDDNTDMGVIITGTRKIDGNGTILAETPNRLRNDSTKDFFLGWFSGKVALYLCSTLYNCERLKEIGGFRSRTNHFLDVVATVKLAALYGRADVYDVKASFRRHYANMGGDPSLVYAWSEDCLYLLDVMCNLLSNDDERAEIRRYGMPFFCRKNYRLTSTIGSRLKRFSTYYEIYKKFNYSYSPVHFLYSRHVRPIKSSLLRRARQIFRPLQAS